MANIKVHVLNFHSIFSHIEIVLENTFTGNFYGINRWEAPMDTWSSVPQNYITQASSVYSFDIEAEPAEIVARWKTHYYETENHASILGENCAVATQWFLTEFARIPEPSLTNVSYNHLALGIVWPSFIPCPITLPGRVMSNAQFYIAARNNPEVANQYSKLFLYTSMALATIALCASALALHMALAVLTGAIAAVAVTSGLVVAVTSIYAFFKVGNILSAQEITSNEQSAKLAEQQVADASQQAAAT